MLNSPAHGTVNLFADGSFVYTPTNGFTGSDAFTFESFDGSMDGNSATVTIDVQGIAPVGAPTVTNDSYQLLHDTTLTEPARQGVLANDQDPTGLPLTASLMSGPSNGQLVLNVGGSFQYVPNAGFVGTDSFTYVANNGTATSSVATVTLNVATMHRPRVLSPTPISTTRC